MVKNMIKPPFLKAGDKIGITCPAKTLRRPIDDAIQLLASWGLKVVLGETVHAVFHQFSGTDELRASDMQRFIDDPDIKAIIAARGGYGCVRIVDAIDFTPLFTQPKWIVGFSDITVFHCHLNKMGIQSIHGQMPSTIPDSSANGLESLRKTLFGEEIHYPVSTHPLTIKGKMNGELIGGNLSILVSVLGSASDPDYDGKILFIEDVGEHLYAVDRMMRALDRAGKLARLKGLIVGGFTHMKDDEETPFGFTVEEIILEVVKKYNYPVSFGFPAGHVQDNWAMKMGGTIQIGE
jgi:muramoyltetrapeptide carboxypeptidase